MWQKTIFIHRAAEQTFLLPISNKKEEFVHQAKKCQHCECELRLHQAGIYQGLATSFQVRSVYLDDDGLYCVQILTRG
jgi:hypothetical protein